MPARSVNQDIVEISNPVFRVGITPRRGADILSVIDVATGVDVLFKTSWPRRGRRVLRRGSSEVEWLSAYPGGWQLLVPNAGSAVQRGDVLWGYHGEASVASWRLDENDRSTARLSVELSTAPLLLERTVRLAGACLEVADSITNLATTAVPVCWVSHPAFGAPFVDGECRIATGARTVVTAGEGSGDLGAVQVAEWPWCLDSRGRLIDMRIAPDAGSGRAAFALLTDFRGGGWFAITSPTVGFGIGLSWDKETHPHAWWWQEANATDAWPWCRRAYVIAIEPANVTPDSLSLEGHGRATPPLLDGHARWETTMTMVRFDGMAPVQRVVGGRVLYAHQV